MSASTNVGSRAAETTSAQITRLRNEAESLMRNKVTPTVIDAVEQVAAAAQNAADTVRVRSEAVAANVRGRPLVSIAMAAVLGFFIGRVTR